MSREARVYERLKDRVCRPGDRFERMENGLVNGMPDVNYCMAGREGWIEIKAPKEPARPDTALFSGNHPVGIEQCNWMLRQSNAGGRCWLFIATEQRLLLLPGSTVAALGRSINTLSARELTERAAWHLTFPLVDPLQWADLRERLCG